MVVVALGLGVLVSPAIAGDAVAQFDLDPSEQSAEAGDAVTVDVVLRSDGGYAGEGVESYAFVVAVPPEIGEPTNVEPGPWLAQDGGEVEQNVTDAGDGAIRVRHERSGVDDGVTGADVAATVTIELQEDAPAADATVLVADPEAQLNGSDFTMRTFGGDATIVVGGGGDDLEPAYEPGQHSGRSSGNDSVGVTTADEANRTVTTGSGDSGEGTDPMPGFGLLAGAMGLALVALAAARRR